MKKIGIGFLQFVALMGALLSLMFVVASRPTAAAQPSLASGIHTHDISYSRVIIHDASAGSLQFETEDHILYSLQIIGAQPTALKPGQLANLYIRQIFEVKGSTEEKSVLSSWTVSPCTPQTPCALFLQAELLQKADQTGPRNTLKVVDPRMPIKLEWR